MAQRLAAAQTGFFLYNAARFLLGALTVWVLSRGRLGKATRAELRGGLLLGAILFIGAALQQAGLAHTTAGKAGFITGMYVILVPLYLTLFWRQPLPRRAWSAALLALVGLLLLSVTEHFTLAPGDGIELLAALLWALHVVLAGRIVAGADPLRVALMQFLVCGLLSAASGLAFEFDRLGSLPSAWAPIVYTGVFSVGLGYTFQLVAQRTAPASDTAVILSLEAVFAAVFGWLLLGELLSAQQVLGAAIMLAAMLLAQVDTVKRLP